MQRSRPIRGSHRCTAKDTESCAQTMLKYPVLCTDTAKIPSSVYWRC